MPDDFFDSPQPSDVSFEDMLAEVDRELKLRKRVYPRWVDQGNLTKATADLQMLKMRAVRHRLIASEAMKESMSYVAENEDWKSVSSIEELAGTRQHALLVLHPETK